MDEVAPTRIGDVMAAIRSRVSGGALATGDRLPSIRGSGLEHGRLALDRGGGL